MSDPVDLQEIDPEEQPFVLLVGGNVGTGQLGSDKDGEARVDVIINTILYLPWNREDEAPREMILVMPSEVAAELGRHLTLQAATIPSASDQALALLTNQEESK